MRAPSMKKPRWGGFKGRRIRLDRTFYVLLSVLLVIVAMSVYVVLPSEGEEPLISMDVRTPLYCEECEYYSEGECVPYTCCYDADCDDGETCLHPGNPGSRCVLMMEPIEKPPAEEPAESEEGPPEERDQGECYVYLNSQMYAEATNCYNELGDYPVCVRDFLEKAREFERSTSESIDNDVIALYNGALRCRRNLEVPANSPENLHVNVQLYTQDYETYGRGYWVTAEEIDEYIAQLELLTT
jgi:hypothetical protein